MPDEYPTRAQIARAEAACLRERADVADAVGAHDLSVTRAFTHPTVYQLQAEEAARRENIADDAAMVLHVTPLDELPEKRQGELIRGASFLLRRPLKAWHAAAMEHAATILAILFADDDEPVSSRLTLEQRKALAVKAAAFAVTSYTSVLEGDHELALGAYLRTQADRVEQEVR